MFSSIPFEVPGAFASGLADGSLTRIGTLIKNTGTGRIIAHVQETGIGQQLVSGFVGSPFSPSSALNAGSSFVANAQLSQLKRMVEGLQILQYANLGVAVAGLGVSIVGFAVISMKLKKIEQSIEHLSQKIDLRFEEFYERQLRRDLSKIRGMFERIELAQRLSDPRIELHSVASSLTEASSTLRDQLEFRLSLNTFDEQLFSLLSQSMMLCDTARVEAYLLAEEFDSAHLAANNIAAVYSELFDDLSPYELAAKRQIEHSVARGKTLSELRRDRVGMQDLVAGVRDITDAAMTKPYLIETLEEQDISGSDYIKRLRSEREQPVLLLTRAD